MSTGVNWDRCTVYHSRVALAMRHTETAVSCTYRLNGLRQGDEHPKRLRYFTCGMTHFTC